MPSQPSVRDEVIDATTTGAVSTSTKQFGRFFCGDKGSDKFAISFVKIAKTIRKWAEHVGRKVNKLGDKCLKIKTNISLNTTSGRSSLRGRRPAGAGVKEDSRVCL